MKQLEELTELEFKEAFIQYFGEDRWNQSEVLPILQEKAEILCSYLDIEEIPKGRFQVLSKREIYHHFR